MGYHIECKDGKKRLHYLNFNGNEFGNIQNILDVEKAATEGKNFNERYENYHTHVRSLPFVTLMYPTKNAFNVKSGHMKNRLLKILINSYSVYKTNNLDSDITITEFLRSIFQNKKSK